MVRIETPDKMRSKRLCENVGDDIKVLLRNSAERILQFCPFAEHSWTIQVICQTSVVVCECVARHRVARYQKITCPNLAISSFKNDQIIVFLSSSFKKAKFGWFGLWKGGMATLARHWVCGTYRQNFQRRKFVLSNHLNLSLNLKRKKLTSEEAWFRME